MKEYLTKEQTDNLFNTITSNGCREMGETRFHQAVNEAISMQAAVKQEITEEKIKYLFDEYTYPQYANNDGILIYSEQELPVYITNYESIRNLVVEIQNIKPKRYPQQTECKKRVKVNIGCELSSVKKQVYAVDNDLRHHLPPKGIEK